MIIFYQEIKWNEYQKYLINYTSCYIFRKAFGAVVLTFFKVLHFAFRKPLSEIFFDCTLHYLLYFIISVL